MIINNLGIKAKYYFVTFTVLLVLNGLFNFIDLSYPNIIFFTTAYVWHLALLTPGLKEIVLVTHHRLSFLAIIVRANHYLQLFINLKRVPFASSFIRALSPMIFTCLLYYVSGEGYILFTLLGSFTFELVYYLFKKFVGKEVNVLLTNTDDPKTRPEKSNEESAHE